MKVIDLARFRRARATGSAGMIRPHRPEDRIVVETVSVTGGAAAFGHWEVRIFDPAGQFHHYFALRAMLHVQLWHPFFGVSILTPSRLTGFNYELFPLNEWKYATPHYADIGDQLRSVMGIRMPDAALVRRVCRTYAGETPPRRSPPVVPIAESTPHVR